MIQRRIALRWPLDLATTLGPLAHGRGDRTIRIGRGEAWLAYYTADGPASLRVVADGASQVTATAWGDGSERALTEAPDLIGESDEPGALTAHHPIIRTLQRRHPGLRLPRTGRVVHRLLPSILEQKVTGTEAFRAYAALLRRHGSPAPGPGGLLLPPTPATLAGLPYHAFHPLGVERRRADVIRRAAARAAWLDAASSTAEAERRLRSLLGIGPWTSAEVRRVAFGDADAVSVGDFHIPNTVVVGARR